MRAQAIRILLISRLFPPLADAQALQIGKVTSELSSMSCDVAVIAGMRAPLGKKLKQLSAIANYAVQYVRYHWSYPTGPRRSALSRIPRRIFKEGDKLLWVHRAAVAAERTLEEFRPDVVFTSSTPVDSHQVGLCLKRRTELPWVASFSDPWPFRLRPSPYNTSETPISKTLDMRLIRNILRECDAVHMPNKYAIELVEKGTSISIAHKAWAIPHIGSSANVAGHCDETNWLVHTGELGPERLCRPLLEAIGEVAVDLGAKFGGLLCVGTVCPEFESMVMELGLRTHVRIMPQVSPEKAVDLTRRAKALLVIEADMPMSPFLPSKFADYASTHRKIIAITPRVSAIRDYLAEYGGGAAVGYSATEVASAIRDAFLAETGHGEMPEQSQTGGLARVFSAETVGKAYAQMLQSVVNSE